MINLPLYVKIKIKNPVYKFHNVVRDHKNNLSTLSSDTGKQVKTINKGNIKIIREKLFNLFLKCDEF